MKQFVTKQHHEQALESLNELIRIPSVLDEADTGKGHPFGTKVDDIQLQLYEASHTHLLLKKIEEKEDSLLFCLIKPLLMKNYNQSMLTTRKLILEGYTFEEVMKIRKIKKGTVTDHLIEWQLYFDDFPYETMISEKTMKRLSQLTNVRTWNYRELNEKEPLDYGEFRFYQIGVLKGEIIDDVAS
ncbi:MAG: helix-turn-helix domain-containing protein [Enterococcus lacertideformus]|uniref:Helix-turn-helix domain-containing protein n=1 Tax=Enterococcus lacertideformus TaxID=2771493 RepID=A0A931AV24_9ENTE|nr:helix-turn-helix domain-containing protein [Enterococcus lacertideformus]